MKKIILFGLFFLFPQPFLSAQGFTDINAGLTGLHYSDVAWGDYDNDGDLDVLISGEDANDVGQTKLYKNEGNDTFTEVTGLPIPGTFVGDFAWGDYDADGDLDILIGGYTDNDQITKLYVNQGNDNFTDSGINFPALADGSESFADYNNDGYIDMLIDGFDGTTYIVQLYKNNGDGTFSVIDPGFPATIKSAYEWGDYDNDGDLDMFLSGFDINGNLISQLYQNNNGTFTQTSNVFTGAWLGDAAWGDYDNDGDLDILLSGFAFPNDRIVKLYKNNGDGTFSEVTSAGLTGVSHCSTIWGDYDNDGNLDVFIAGTYPQGSTWIRVTDVFINNGDDTFTAAGLSFTADAFWGESAWGDYDNDGDLDLICCGYDDAGGSNTIIYRNDAMVANTPPQTPSNLFAAISGTDVTLSWDASSDNETPSTGLTYNAYLKDNNGNIIWNSMADIPTGFKLFPSLGNAQQSTNWKIKNLTYGSTYLFSVQAVDNNFAGSAFAPEFSFVFDTTIVPVELSSFSLSADQNNVELKWTTATELNNSGFEIQRINMGKTGWQNIAFVKGNGTSSKIMNYSYIDINVKAGSYFYRLKQVDFDGTFSFSEKLSVTIAAPDEFVLFQNYPNPFNPTTSIKINLPVQAEVQLNVYNALGEKVARIFSGLLNEGIHEFSFDGSSLPSGIYIYRIESDNFSAMKKMILLR